MKKGLVQRRIMLDANTCYGVLVARDARFDGLFFVGVTTTGVYCRPICSARTPRQDRCSFFRSPAEAEKSGFRACFRCRPELAPGNAAVDALPRLVEKAVQFIHEGFLNEHGVDELAAQLGVTGRHLRRAMEDEIGVSPIELAQSRRLALAKQLLQDSRVGLTEIAFASGFQSVRRFNALFRERFGRAPSEVRRHDQDARASQTMTLRLDFREPFDWEHHLAFLRNRAIPGVEYVSESEYTRVIHVDGKTGVIRVSRDLTRQALRAEVSLSLSGAMMKVVSKLRKVFDLDARPDVIAERLGSDRVLSPLVKRRPGLRLPGATDAFEMTVRTVLGQQVSVRAASTLAGRLVKRLGQPLTEGTTTGLTHRFPTAEEVAVATVDDIASIGLPRKRAESLQAVAQAVISQRLALPGPVAAPEDFARQLVALPGFGTWSAEYLVMRALHHPDAFPASDLGIRKALGGMTANAAMAYAEAWRPWRSYAVMHLWTALSKGELP